MKRNHDDYSSSDSEFDENTEAEKDGVDDNGSPCSPHGSMSPPTSSQVQARKRRRGIIEKRRRDRINNSLSELRRLVPSAFEKQGSAKLEKAEILQMTVDHLKMLHASGDKGYLEAHTLAMDYRSLGFRECLTETARYLSIMEGLDSADPLRLRLVTHLHNYASQREGLGHLAWSSAFGPAPTQLVHHFLLHHQQGQAAPRATASAPPSPSSSSAESGALSRLSGGPHADPGPLRIPLNGVFPPSLLVATSKLSPPLLSSVPSLTAFPFPFSALPILSSSALSPSAPSAGLGKPHRPWGTEIGAF